MFNLSHLIYFSISFYSSQIEAVIMKQEVFMVHIIFLTILDYFATRLSPIRNNLSGVMSMAQYHYPMQCFFFMFLIYYWYQLYKITKRKALVHISGICLIISLFMPFKRSSHDFFSECHTYAGFVGIIFVVSTLAMILYDLNQYILSL